MTQARDTRSPSLWRRMLRWVRISVALVTTLTVIAALAAVGFVGYQLKQAGVSVESIPALTDPSKAPLPQPIRYYSADGELLGRRGTEQRIVLSPRDVPQVMRDAIVAIEDQRFYEHRGVDFQALARAAWVDLRAGSAAEGASTLTMQYVRNVYLDFQKTAHRKVKEIALAVQLESQWGKTRVLTAYLNTAAMGPNVYGVQAASRYYFGVDAKDLRLHQASLLAGLVQAPTKLDPRRNRAGARARQAVVLDEMYAQGMITRRQAEQAKRRKLRLRKLTRAEQPSEPALVQMLEDETRRRMSKTQFRRGGFNVQASFKMSDVRQARRTLTQAYPQLPASQRPVVAASFVEPETGRVKLIAHSRSEQSYFDYATQARRQPGSTVKAFTAAQYLREGGQLADPVDNSPVNVARQDGSSYTVQPTQSGVRNVFDMLRFSQNPAAWRLFAKAGGKDVLALEKRLGVRGLDSNPAAALGGVRHGTNTLEMAGAFAVIAGEGQMPQAHAVVRIEDLLGNLMWADDKLAERRRLEAEYARQLTVGLRRVVTDGFPQLRRSLKVAKYRQLAGKTGTSENNADAWFAGYTPQLAGAIWTGYATSRRSLANLPGGAVWGSSIPAQNFSKLAQHLLAGQPVRRFRAPLGIQRVPYVVGSQQKAAAQRLTQLRFSAVSYVAKFSADAKPGKVLSQQPRADTWVRADTPVRVVYATDQRPTPTLVGKAFTEAERQLGSFAPVKLKFKVSSEPVGTVLEQLPYAGQPLRYRKPVTLTVATQPGPIRYRIKKVKYVPTESELAELRRQVKAAERRAAQAEGKVTVRVPDLTGLEQVAAEQIVSSLGLQLDVTGAGSTVTEQRPAPGTSASPGQTLFVNVE